MLWSVGMYVLKELVKILAALPHDLVQAAGRQEKVWRRREALHFATEVVWEDPTLVPEVLEAIGTADRVETYGLVYTHGLRIFLAGNTGLLLVHINQAGKCVASRIAEPVYLEMVA